MAHAAEWLKKVRKSERFFGASFRALSYIGACAHGKKPTVVVARNHLVMERMAAEARFFNPKANVQTFPSWDVQPYDRLSPESSILSQRLKTLNALNNADNILIFTTVNALTLKVVSQDELPRSLTLQQGQEVGRDALIQTLEQNGYLRVGTVMEAGEYAVRGAIVDIFIPTLEQPIRLDFFDDEIEKLSFFDPSTQRTEEAVKEPLSLGAATDFVLDEETISTFRTAYRSAFPKGGEDSIYADISAGKRHESSAHFLPLFLKQPMVSFFDYLPEGTQIFAERLHEEALQARLDEVEEAYKARKNFESEHIEGEDVYRAIKPNLLYLNKEDWEKGTTKHKFTILEALDDGSKEVARIPVEALHLAEEKKTPSHILDDVVAKVQECKANGYHILLSALSSGSLVRMEKTLHSHGLENVRSIKKWLEVFKNKLPCVALTPIGWGFEDKEAKLLVVTEQDMFGEKAGKSYKRKRSDAEIIAHFSEIEPGSLVVHSEHGIGKFEGLVTLDVGEARQDFLLLIYDGGDKLYVPATSLDVLSKYSGEGARLDKLGGAAWQARKASVKKDLLAMAGDLLKIAAERETRKGYRFKQPDGLYDEFCAGFPYIPTAEQQRSVEEVEADMFSEKPMDRLVVGDVGFGKTEIALRAAFVAAADGKQVAVVVPTTLLARQHMDVFSKRFANFPFKVALLSRFVTGKQKQNTLEGLKKGEVDIIIGTHALLGKDVKFNDLGLLVVDEEQRFGVKHKEKLKELKETVDVLTLTATPIPRTLQMALSGLRGLSLITTPPVDRLAVRTYAMKFDKKVVREAILREIFRGGQVFVITPRVEGLEKLAEILTNLVPEAKIRIAHGQMPKDALDRTMTDFYEGHFNVLISTTIIESGIDVPKANTLLVHRADMFGLAQLYQIRGRVGRSKVRAYAYMLLPHGRITPDAVKRLQILQRLDGLGAGFNLASYDMDIRGSGNLLGTEQSGHVKEVGFELYNKMLHEAVEEKKAETTGEVYEAHDFTPTLNLGLSFLVPESYVEDVTTRMQLYRRLSTLLEAEDFESFKEELEDRFGALPAEVVALLEVVAIKNRCRNLNVEKVEVGPKGVVLSFYQNTFKNPEGLMKFIMANHGVVSLKPADQKVIFHRALPDGLSRLHGVQSILHTLETL